MNNLTKSTNVYNKNIDSVGTEMSYSATSVMPDDFVQKIPNMQGGFIGSLFGHKKTYGITNLVIDAIMEGRLDCAEYILSKQFVPDIDVLTENGDNLVHVLTMVANNSENALKALIFLITCEKYKSALNHANKQGDTPLHVAVKTDQHELALFMEKHGAVRSKNNDLYIIDTDESVKNETNAKTTLSERPINITIISDSSDKPTIFAKPDDMNNTGDMTIRDIVKYFKTVSDDTFDMTKTIENGNISKNSPALQATVYKKADKNGSQNHSNTRNDANEETDDFVNRIVRILKNDEMVGGSMSNTKSTNNRITGKRVMKTFSELSDTHNMFGRDSELSEMARNSIEKKDKMHEKAIDKIMAHLEKKDIAMAKAIKEIIYSEIVHKGGYLSSLDKASELLRAINGNKIEKVMQNKKEINRMMKKIR